MEERIKITHKQLDNVLNSKKPILVYGKSGTGKTKHIIDYAKKHKLKIVFADLCAKLPEDIGGVPSVQGEYFVRAYDGDLKDFFECEGEGYILIIDEINQGSPEVLNTLYNITHPDPTMRRWGTHPIGKCQIVAMGNLNDGRDKTVYLTELPTPLEERFFVYELIASDKETTDYLKSKYKNIPQVAKYIKVLLDNGVSPRNADLVLEILQYDYDGLLLEAKLGTALATKLLDIQKNITSLDPAEMLKNARTIYDKFNENGYVIFGAETIKTKDDLIEKFKEFLSEEEIAGIVKGDK